MEHEALLEAVSDYEDAYEELWQSFKVECNKCKSSGELENEVFLEKENFKNRLRILEEAEDFGKEEISLPKNSRDHTKAWLNIENIQEGEYLRISDRNLQNCINPFAALRMLKKGVHPYEESLKLQGLLSLCLQEESRLRLAFSANGTFITGKGEDFDLTG